MMQSASARIFELTNWATVQFLLENAVFLLIGLQVHRILSDVGDSKPAGVSHRTHGRGGLRRRCAPSTLVGISGPVGLPGTLPTAARAHAPPWRILTVLSWAGMRGVVTDFGLLFVVTGKDDTGHHGRRKLITGFLVDLHTPGLTVRRVPSRDPVLSPRKAPQDGGDTDARQRPDPGPPREWAHPAECAS
jgi:NhaP-type Na+/H+ or K+/H+ antiporter